MLFSILLFTIVSLVPGSSMTWTDGVDTWAGNPSCKDSGMLLQSTSPAIDMGAVIDGFHCPNPGPDSSGTCIEWYGSAPDAGACEYVPNQQPPPPPLAPEAPGTFKAM